MGGVTGGVTGGVMGGGNAIGEGERACQSQCQRGGVNHM